MRRLIESENEWPLLAAEWVKTIPPGFRLYLSGELGVGKTTLVRNLLRQWGVRDTVKSPTYTLVETYTIDNKIIHHFDLYRLQSPLELQYIGLEDYFDQSAIVIVEWPEKGLNILPTADMYCTLAYHAEGRSMHCVANSPRGQAVLAQWEKK